MEVRIGGLLFTSKFDSGNMSRVEKVTHDEDDSDAGGTNNNCYVGLDNKADQEFNVWTNPDCAGTEFENPNRSWFYFGIRGWTCNRLIKINIMNMNRQGKLYSQGLSPFVRVLPGKPKWERIRDRPTYETVDGQFNLSFTYRFPEFRGGTAYFAFCFPWSYTESQEKLMTIEKHFSTQGSYSSSNCDPERIYYHRELLCETLDKLRIDLITISSCHGLTDREEPRFDQYLFPDKITPRSRRFKGKRVFVLSSRVHPGETPASYVFNGFLDFILRERDPRAKQLRRQFVFKLIPMLNPDGVMRGHYRTDSRGVNLNRVYLDPSPLVHPSIYAAKSIIVYHHLQERDRLETGSDGINIKFPGGGRVPSQSELDNIITNSETPCEEEKGTQRTYTLSAPSVLNNHEDGSVRETDHHKGDDSLFNSHDSAYLSSVTGKDIEHGDGEIKTQTQNPGDNHHIGGHVVPLSRRKNSARVDMAKEGGKLDNYENKSTHNNGQQSQRLVNGYQMNNHQNISKPVSHRHQNQSSIPTPHRLLNHNHNHQKQKDHLSKESGMDNEISGERNIHHRHHHHHHPSSTQEQLIQGSGDSQTPLPSSSPWLGSNIQTNKPKKPVVSLHKLPAVEPLDLADLDDGDAHNTTITNQAQHGSSSGSSLVSLFDQGVSDTRQVDSDLRLKLSSLNMSEELNKNSALSFGIDSENENNTFTERIGNEGSDDEGDNGKLEITDGNNAPHLRDPILTQIPPHASGVALYVDLHGHASKRGCFIYGNYFENEDVQVENMLFPKLISMNTAHFDFTGCNFSEKNMYSKDKRDGMSKEGSGRVAMFKATGIIHSYTLECNYNTGRMVNPVPPAYGDDGRATPPPNTGFPPKYSQAHYEEVGKAVAVSALDITNSNPWSRITLSEHNSLHAVKETVRRYLRGLRGLPRVQKNSNSFRSLNSKGSTASPLNQTIQRKTSLSDSSSAGGTAGGVQRGFRHGQEVSSRLYPGPNNQANHVNSRFNNKRELGPVREATRSNLATQPQSHRRRMPYNGPASKTPTTMATLPVTLNLTTAGEESHLHFTLSGDARLRDGDASLKSRESQASFKSGESAVSLKSREEDKVQQLRNVNLVSKRNGPPSRIPLATRKSQIHLPSSAGVDMSLSARLMAPENQRQTKSGPASSGIATDRVQRETLEAGVMSPAVKGAMMFNPMPFGNDQGKPDSSGKDRISQDIYGSKKSRKSFTSSRRRGSNQSPKVTVNVKGQNSRSSGGESETDSKRIQRRRKRGSHRHQNNNNTTTTTTTTTITHTTGTLSPSVLEKPDDDHHPLLGRVDPSLGHSDPNLSPTGLLVMDETRQEPVKICMKTFSAATSHHRWSTGSSSVVKGRRSSDPQTGIRKGSGRSRV